MFSTQRLSCAHRIFAIALVLLALAALVPQAAIAQSLYQSVEWESYQSGKYRYSLTYDGLRKGCKPDQPNNTDYKFWINLNASRNPDNARIFSSDGLVRNAFQNKSPMANFNYRPYICLGITEVVLSGGPGRVAQHLYVWYR